MIQLIDAFNARIPGVHLRTVEEDRGLDLIAATCQASGHKLLVWTACTGLCGADVEDVAKRVPLKVNELPLALTYLSADEKRGENVSYCVALCDPFPFLNDPRTRRFLREALVRAKNMGDCIVLLGGDWGAPPEIAPHVYVMDIPLPDEALLKKYLEALTAKYAEVLKEKVKVDAASVSGLARACRGLTLHEARNVTSMAITKHKAIGPEAVALALREKQQVVKKNPILTYEEVVGGLEDVGGLENLKEWLTKRVKLFGAHAGKFGIEAPRGIALIGLPGTGKSLVARKIASAWGLPMVKCDLSAARGSLVGQTEGAIRAGFRTIGAVAPCVVLFDEADKMIGGGEGPSVNDVDNAARGMVLTWLNDHQDGAFPIFTSNGPDSMPPEMLRAGRVDAVFAVDLPSEAARAEIIRIHLRLAGHAKDVKSVSGIALATEGFSGAELKKVVQDALIEALSEDRETVTLEDLAKAARGVVPVSTTRQDEIKKLREWITSRKAMPAGIAVEVDRERRAAARRENADVPKV